VQLGNDLTEPQVIKGCMTGLFFFFEK